MKFNITSGTSLLSMLRGRKSSQSNLLIHPAREWGISLLLTVVIALSFFSFIGYDFYLQLTDNDRPTVSEEHIPKYRAAEATNLIRFYEGKEEQFQSLRANGVVPSAVDQLADAVQAVIADETTGE